MDSASYMGAGDDKGDALGVQAEPATGIIEGAFVHDRLSTIFCVNHARAWTDPGGHVGW